MKKRLVPALLLIALVCALFTMAIPAAEAPNFVVAYDANGGEGTMASSNGSQLSKNSFTNDGYDFVGWATTPDGEAVYADEAEIAEVIPALGGKLVLDEEVASEVVFTADDEGILLDWKVKSGTKNVWNNVVSFTYDSNVLQLVDASGNAVTIPETRGSVVAAQLSSHAAMTWPNTMTAYKGENGLVHFAIERGVDVDVEISFADFTSIGTCRLAYQSGKSAADVTADTLRIAAQDELAGFSNKYAFYLSDSDAEEYIYEDADFAAHTTLYAVWEEAAPAHAHGTITDWTALPTGGALTSGNYFAEDDMALTAALTVAEGAEVTVCLNGKTLTPAAGNTANAFINNGTLTICDCDTAAVQGYIDAATYLWVKGTAPSGATEVELTGGIITGFGDSAILNKKGTFTLTSGNIAGNKAIGHGGGIYNETAGTVKMTGGAIVGNYAPTSNGGGIFNISGVLEISAGTIGYNTAALNGGGIAVNGSASDQATFTMTGGTVIGNVAGVNTASTSGSQGGGIYINGSDTSNYAKVSMTGVTIIGNETKMTANKNSGRAGGILSYSKLNMTDCVVKDNVAGGQGGGIYASAGGAELLRVTVEGNEAKTSAGGVYLSSTVTATDCVIKNNVAAVNGGGIQNYEAAYTMVLNNCTITGNVSNGTKTDLADPSGGGGIYVSKLSTVILNGGVISGNTAQKAGGGVLVRGNLVMNANTEFNGNNLVAAQTWTLGGLAMYVAKTGNVTMNGGKIINHKSTTGSRKGVAIQTAGTFTMNDGEISGNTATTTNFGIVSVFEGTFTMKGGSIKNNNADKVDGTVYVYGDPAGATSTAGGHFYMEGGEISGNASRRGVLYITGANASTKISGGTFKGNSFSDTSSANYAQVYVGSSGSLEIIGGTFLTTDGTSVLNVNTYVPADYEQNATTGTVALKEALVTVRVYDGDEVIYTSKDLLDAIKKYAGTDKVIKMFADYTSSVGKDTYAISGTKHFVLDMNGYSIYSPNGNGIQMAQDTGVTKIYSSAAKKGTIESAQYTCYFSQGGLHLENINIICHGNHGVGYTYTKGTYNDKNLIKDCVIYGATWAPFVFNNSSTSQSAVKMTFDNCDIIVGQGKTGAAINAQGGAKNPSILLKGAMRLYTAGGKYKADGIQLASGSVVMEKTGTGQSYKVTDAITVTNLNKWTAICEVATADQLKAAVSNEKVERIKLTAAITDNAAVVSVGARTLDLNGKVLTVNSLIADSGNVVDNTHKDGKLVVGTTDGKANVTFRSANTQLAVGDANGIWFTEISNATKFEQKDANVATYAFNFYLRNPNAKAYLIANPTAASIGATAVVKIDGVKKDKGFGVKDVAGLAEGEHPVSYLLQNPANGVKLTMKGIAEFEDATVNGWIAINGTSKTFKGYTMNPSAN